MAHKPDKHQAGGVSGLGTSISPGRVDFTGAGSVLPITNADYFRGVQLSLSKQRVQQREEALQSAIESAFIDLQDDFFGVPVHNENQRKRLADIAGQFGISMDDATSLDFSDKFAVKSHMSKYRKAINSAGFQDVLGEISGANKLRDLAFRTLKDDRDGLKGFLETWSSYQNYDGTLPYSVAVELNPTQFQTPEDVDFVGDYRQILNQSELLDEEDEQSARILFNTLLAGNPESAERQGLLKPGMTDLAQSGVVTDDMLTEQAVTLRDNLAEVVPSRGRSRSSRTTSFFDEYVNLLNKSKVQGDIGEDAAKALFGILLAEDPELAEAQGLLKPGVFDPSSGGLITEDMLTEKGIALRDSASEIVPSRSSASDDDTSEEEEDPLFSGGSEQARTGRFIIGRLRNEGATITDELRSEILSGLEEGTPADDVFENVLDSARDKGLADTRVSRLFPDGPLSQTNLSVKAGVNVKDLSNQGLALLASFNDSKDNPFSSFNTPNLVITSGLRKDGSSHIGGDNIDIRTEPSLRGGVEGRRLAVFLMTDEGRQHLDKIGTHGYDAIWEFPSDEQLPEGAVNGMRIGGVLIKVNPSINSEHLHLQAKVPTPGVEQASPTEPDTVRPNDIQVPGEPDSQAAPLDTPVFKFRDQWYAPQVDSTESGNQ